jgi:hypothetical protein
MQTASILPFPTPASPEAARQAQSDLAQAFRSDLAWAVAGEEEPSYELLEQYVQGTLDAESAERLESRAAVDSNLAREIDELVALRTRLRPAARPEIRPAVRIFRLAVLAATLVVAVIGLDRTLEQRSAGSADSILAGHTAPAPLYADGFESGDASAWSN